MDLKENQNKEISNKKSVNINTKNLTKLIGGVLLVISLPFLYMFMFSSDEKQEKTEPTTFGNDDTLISQGVANNLPSDYSSRKNEIDNTINEELEKNKISEEKPIQEIREQVNYNEPKQLTEEEMFAQEIKRRRREAQLEAKMSGFQKSNKSINQNMGSSSNNGANGNPALDPAFLSSLYKQEKDDPNMQKQRKDFLKNSAIDEFVLTKTLTPSLSRYEVKTGSIIPVTMWAKVNSDNPGSILAITRETVYDSLTGTIKLIPMGTKLYGQYSSEVAFGQERVQIVFNRMTLPNGKSINLGSMIGSDLEGQSGLKDKVDTHMTKVVASVVMSAILGAGTAITTDNNSNNDNDWRYAAGQGAGEQMINVGNKYAEKVLNVQPTLTIRSGFRANIIIDKDIILESYQNNVEYIFN
ncbi:MAG: TrbI/VirB10 family protein [Cetobacterium sp.]